MPGYDDLSDDDKQKLSQYIGQQQNPDQAKQAALQQLAAPLSPDKAQMIQNIGTAGMGRIGSIGAEALQGIKAAAPAMATAAEDAAPGLKAEFQKLRELLGPRIPTADEASALKGLSNKAYQAGDIGTTRQAMNLAGKAR